MANKSNGNVTDLFGFPKVEEVDGMEVEEEEENSWERTEIRTAHPAPGGMMAVMQKADRLIPMPVVSFSVCVFKNRETQDETTEIRPFVMDLLTGEVGDVNEFDGDLICITVPGQDPEETARSVLQALHESES